MRRKFIDPVHYPIHRRTNSRRSQEGVVMSAEKECMSGGNSFTAAWRVCGRGTACLTVPTGEPRSFTLGAIDSPQPQRAKPLLEFPLPQTSRSPFTTERLCDPTSKILNPPPRHNQTDKRTFLDANSGLFTAHTICKNRPTH